MSFLLDTNICSAFMRRPASLAHRFFQHSGVLFVPTIVLAELYAGAYSSPSSARYLQGIADLLTGISSLPFDEAGAETFGRIRGSLQQSGIRFNPVDLLIGASALVHNLTLVTHNTKHFEQIPGLRLEDWLVP